MTIDERITELAASAPALTAEQRARLAALFRTGERIPEARAS